MDAQELKINNIYHMDCLSGLSILPDKSVDCCVTSPPYWGLRDYGHEDQLGDEKHFKDFVQNLVNIFDEVKRVLKDTGTCFINLGDSYSTTVRGTGGTHYPDGTPYKQTTNKGSRYEIKYFKTGLPNKCLCLVPERFAIEMIDRGWTLRNQIIWHKPNQMPSSAKDRFTVDFEKVFFFVKQPVGYYFEQQLEPYTGPMNRRPNENGRNMRTVWSLNTRPITDSHFATYPQKLVQRMVVSGCPEGGVVLDPFMGSGTTAVVARKLGRNYIGFELNADYIKIAEKRLHNELGIFL